MADTATTENLREAALRYVADRATQYLLQIGEPAKTGQVTGFVSEEHPVSVKVVRDALTLDPRFVQKERRWDLGARDVNAQHPLERTIEDLLRGVGRPLLVDTIGVEIAKATGASPEAETETVRRLVTRRPRFLVLGDDRVALAEWLLDVDGETTEDALLDNFDDPADVDPFRGLVVDADWNNAARATAHLIEAAGRPVPGKVAAFLAYEATGAAFDPKAFFQALYGSDLRLLSDGSWVSSGFVDTLQPEWERIADEPPVEGSPEEATRPAGEVVITPGDLEEISAIVRRTDGFVTSRQILEQVLEVNAGDRDYEKWETTLADALLQQGEVINVGWDRWRRFETIPTDVLNLPDTLTFQDYSFQTLEGEELDVVLSEDGLDGNLREIIRQPMATLGGECKPQKDGSARCTLTILHNNTGALPVGGDNPYFPTDPVLLEASITGPNGRFSLWVNNTLGLAFGLEEVAATLPESGGVFFLRPGNRPGDYRLEVSGELDPVIGIDEHRLKELRAVAARPNFDTTSNFDLVCEFLERHRKGADFFTLLSEMWVIRPVRPLLIASLLSEYYCFRQNKNGSWAFDPRELDKGFKKAKRKYVK